MIFEWDEHKARSNKAKHGVSFEAATFVFLDLRAITVLDHRYDEERWITIGKAGNRVLTVAHSIYEDEHEEIIRIISARDATPAERRRYYAD